MIFREAKLSDLDQIAKLHQQNLKTATSFLGEDYLKRMYQQIISDSKTNTTILALEDEKVIGVITASLDLRKTVGALPLSFFSIVLITKKILFQPSLILEILNHICLEIVVLHKYPRPYRTILTLFVSNSYQRLGIGSKLVQELIHKLKAMNIKKLYVDTQKRNKEALEFYKKMGFEKEDQIADSIVLSLYLNLPGKYLQPDGFDLIKS